MSSNDDVDINEVMKFKIKGATAPVLSEPDWAANLEIIDFVNAHPQYASRAAKLLKRRIKHWNPTVGLWALHLTEGIVKNCPCFHTYAGEQSFLDAMLKELDRKVPKQKLVHKIGLQQQNVTERARLERKDKILLLLESWGKGFQKSQHRNFTLVYEDLARSGVRFPHPMKDEISPLFTPAERPVRSSVVLDGPVSDKELISVMTSIEVFRDAVNASDKGEDLTENNLVQSMLSSLQNAQAHIATRIGRVPSEELMNELLLTNDEIVKAIEHYEGVRNGEVKRTKVNRGASDEKADKKKNADQDVDAPPAFEDLLDLGAFASVPAAAAASSAVRSSPHSDAELTSEESSDEEENLNQVVENDSQLVPVHLTKLAPPPSSQGKRVVKSGVTKLGSFDASADEDPFGDFKESSKEKKKNAKGNDIGNDNDNEDLLDLSGMSL